jgi:hypothetical protein
MKIDLKNCTLFIRRTSQANTPPPGGEADQGDYLIVKFGEGNFTYTIRRNIIYELDRGKLDDVRRGDEAPMDITFGGKYEYVMSIPAGSDPLRTDLANAYRNQLTIQEAVRGKKFDGSTAHPWLVPGLSPSGVEREPWLACTPYCTTLELHNDLRRECPDLLDTPGEAVLFRYFRAESVDNDTKAGTVAISGKANILRPNVLNPFPQGGTGPVYWLYEIDPGEVPIPFLCPTDWPYDRRDPLYTP